MLHIHSHLGNGVCKKYCDPSRHLQESPGPPSPKSQKRSEKESFLAVRQKTPKIPQKSKNDPKVQFSEFWGPFLTFEDFFRGLLFGTHQNHPFWDLFAILGPERLETPVNGGSDRNASMTDNLELVHDALFQQLCHLSKAGSQRQEKPRSKGVCTCQHHPRDHPDEVNQLYSCLYFVQHIDYDESKFR